MGISQAASKSSYLNCKKNFVSRAQLIAQWAEHCIQEAQIKLLAPHASLSTVV